MTMPSVFILLWVCLLTGPCFGATPPLASTPVQTSPRLRWYGYAGVDSGLDDPHDGIVKTNYLDETASFTNCAGLTVFDPGQDITARLQLMAANSVGAIIDLQAIFYERIVPPTRPGASGSQFRLRLDYRTRWERLISTSALRRHEKAIACFYLADEPAWNGILAADLANQAELVKATFPDIPTLVVEAPPAIVQLVVPPTVDWIGFDHYAIPDPHRHPVYLQELAALKARRSAPGQRIVLIMEGQWRRFYQDAGYPPEAMAQVATSYFQLALSDPDVVGLIAYLWPGGLDGPDQLGARNLPETVRAEHRRIGGLITGKTAGSGALAR